MTLGNMPILIFMNVMQNFKTDIEKKFCLSTESTFTLQIESI